MKPLRYWMITSPNPKPQGKKVCYLYSELLKVTMRWSLYFIKMRLYKPILSNEALKEEISLSMSFSPSIVESSGWEVVNLSLPPRETISSSCYGNCLGTFVSIEEKTSPRCGGRVVGVQNIDGNHPTCVRERRSYDSSEETMLKYQSMRCHARGVRRGLHHLIKHALPCPNLVGQNW